ncbi:MAG: hypothetical protein AB2807_11505, partial [Candidatus Sedimenticola endophacoides]
PLFVFKLNTNRNPHNIVPNQENDSYFTLFAVWYTSRPRYISIAASNQKIEMETATLLCVSETSDFLPQA